MGAIVVELRFGRSVSRLAGKRNDGFAKLPADVDFVQFVDGDCELAVNWIGIAMAVNSAHKRRRRSSAADGEKNFRVHPSTIICATWNGIRR